jgi:hypothetical protein
MVACSFEICAASTPDEPPPAFVSIAVGSTEDADSLVNASSSHVWCDGNSHFKTGSESRLGVPKRFSVAAGHRLAAGLEQKPCPLFSLVDPVLDEARAGHVIALVAVVMGLPSLALTCRVFAVTRARAELRENSWGSRLTSPRAALGDGKIISRMAKIAGCPTRGQCWSGNDLLILRQRVDPASRWDNRPLCVQRSARRDRAKWRAACNARLAMRVASAGRRGARSSLRLRQDIDKKSTRHLT